MVIVSSKEMMTLMRKPMKHFRSAHVQRLRLSIRLNRIRPAKEKGHSLAGYRQLARSSAGRAAPSLTLSTQKINEKAKIRQPEFNIYNDCPVFCPVFIDEISEDGQNKSSNDAGFRDF